MKINGIRFLFLSAALAAMGLGMSSCEDHPQHIESSWGDGMSVKDEISLDGATSTTLNIKATTKPKLTTEADWLKIGEVKSFTTGIYTIELTAEVNATGETRTAEITVTAGKETATVKVIQVSSDVVEIKSVLPEGDLDPAGGTLTINYSATGTPAANLPEWMRTVASRSLQDGQLTLTYLPNNTGREREGMIVLAVGKGAVANVTVRQKSL
ncbi:MAG: hypothetical protein K2H38_05915 [Muribaculaceae bacterium]|nr:hypothetical protein [Muribaculaceae bacterium]MDE6551529.1 hypothetical protein [Muribaculaceae bacterium]